MTDWGSLGRLPEASRVGMGKGANPERACQAEQSDPGSCKELARNGVSAEEREVLAACGNFPLKMPQSRLASPHPNSAGGEGQSLPSK